MRKYCLLALLLFLSSCAMIINKPYTNVHFFSEEENVSFILDNDSTIVYQTDTIVPVKRSKYPLLVNIISDSILNVQYSINSKLSTSYVFGNVVTLYAGYFVDLFTPKMYTYPGYIRLEKDKVYVYPLTGYSKRAKPDYVLKADSLAAIKSFDGNYTVVERKRKIRTPGKVNLLFEPFGIYSFNWNTFAERDYDNFAISTGLGMNYYLKPDLRLSIMGEAMWHTSGLTMEDFYFDNYDYSSNTSTVISGKIQIGKPVSKRIWIDAGLQLFHSSYSDFNYDFKETFSDPYIGHTTSRRTENKNNIGLALSASYRAGINSFTLNYYPSVVSFNRNKKDWNFEYNHIIGLIWVCEISMKTGRRPTKQ